jgi:hypothetical protein
VANEKGDTGIGAAAEGNGRFLEAAQHIRGSASANAKLTQGTAGEIGRQARALADWAIKTGRIVAPQQMPGLRPVSSATSEHKIYFDAATNRALKQTLPGEFGYLPAEANGRWSLDVATPLDYLRRWHLFNHVFHGDVWLEGANAGKGAVSAVISQPWHMAADTAAPNPTEAEVSAFLRGEGFEPVPRSQGGWRRTSDGIVILDAYPDNFIKTKEGIIPVDLPMTQEGNQALAGTDKA